MKTCSPHIRLGDNLHQSCTSSIEIHQNFVPDRLRFRSILLNLQLMYPDVKRSRGAILSLVDLYETVPSERICTRSDVDEMEEMIHTVVLRDLVRRRDVMVEIVFSVKCRSRVLPIDQLIRVQMALAIRQFRARQVNNDSLIASGSST